MNKTIYGRDNTKIVNCLNASFSVVVFVRNPLPLPPPRAAIDRSEVEKTA